MVDLIPLEDSAETAQNSEPSLAVNPFQPLDLVAGSFNGLNEPAIYFKSTNGGNTWSAFGTLPAADKSLAWSPNGSVLTATLDPNNNYNLQIFSGTATGTSFSSAISTVNPGKFSDQPWIRTGPIPDQVYVAANTSPSFTTASTKSATINVSSDGGRTFNPITIDQKGGNPQLLQLNIPVDGDGNQVREAVSPNGKTVYAVFTRRNTIEEDRGTGIDYRFGSEVVVVRSDNGGADAFTALGSNGVTAATTISVSGREPNTSLTLGQERVVGDVAIAVDPNEKDHVVVAYGDAPGPKGSNLMKLVVTESFNGGKTWMQKFETTSTLQIRQGLPSLAILRTGVIALLYLEYESDSDQPVPSSPPRLSTHLLVTADDFHNTADTVLNRQPDNFPVAQAPDSFPYVGDFFDMTSLSYTTSGNTLYGVFSGSNFDAHCELLFGFACFPNDVSFQRAFVGTPGMGDFALRDGLGSPAGPPNPVDWSIDPFFFAINLDDLTLPCGIDCTTLLPLTLVPEPGSLAILGVALVGFGLARRRKVL